MIGLSDSKLYASGAFRLPVHAAPNLILRPDIRRTFRNGQERERRGIVPWLIERRKFADPPKSSSAVRLCFSSSLPSSKADVQILDGPYLALAPPLAHLLFHSWCVSSSRFNDGDGGAYRARDDGVDDDNADDPESRANRQWPSR